MFYQEDSENYQKTLSHTLRLKHGYLPDFSEESLFEGTDRTYSNIYVSLPYPIHKPLDDTCNTIQNLTKAKEIYNNSLKRRQIRYKKHDKNKINKKLLDDHRFISLPHYLIDFYKELDPDKYFDGDYDYYCTGGSLEKFTYNNNDYLIRPDADNNLCINKVSGNKVIIDDVTRINFQTKSAILNIQSTITDDGLFFVLREKDTVNAVLFDSVDSVTLKYSRVHKYPLLDAKLSKDFKLGTLFVNGKFSIKNIETNNTLLSFISDLDDQVDKFQQFRYLDDNTVILMDRSKVRVIDIRSKEESNCFEPKLADCNSFCNFTILNDTVLLTSRHYVLKTDLRQFEKVFHYTHFLDNVPIYMDHANKDLDTYLVVAGNNPDNKVLFTGNSPHSVPYKIPDLKQTLIETITQHPSLSLQHHLQSKVNQPITGLKVLNVDDEMCIFTSNFLGDIYKQTVNENRCDNGYAIVMMSKWCGMIKEPLPVVNLTHYENLSDIRFKLDKSIPKKSLPKENYTKRDKFLNKFQPIYSSKNVKSQLAKDFLQIWEDSDEEDEVIEDLPEEETLQKVENWIKSNKFEDDEF